MSEYVRKDMIRSIISKIGQPEYNDLFEIAEAELSKFDQVISMGRSGTKYHYDWTKRQQAYLKQRNESWDFGAREAVFIWSRTGMTRHAGMQSKLLAVHDHYTVDIPKEENADEKGRRIKRLERITHHLIRSLCDATEYTQKIRRNVLVMGHFPTSEGETASRAERPQLTAMKVSEEYRAYFCTKYSKVDTALLYSWHANRRILETWERKSVRPQKVEDVTMLQPAMLLGSSAETQRRTESQTLLFD